MQLCGLILIVHVLFNLICPASSRARINSSKKARRNRHRTPPPQGPRVMTTSAVRLFRESAGPGRAFECLNRLPSSKAEIKREIKARVCNNSLCFS
jgi:hypothetical protein